MRQDYVNARFLQWWASSPKIFNSETFPKWMKYECKIANASKLTIQMKQEGFLRDGTFEEQLSCLTLTDLKTIIASQNLTKAKKKQDIIDVIINEANREKLNLSPVITISDSGLLYIEEHKSLIAGDASAIADYIIKDNCGNITGVDCDKYSIDFEVNTGPFTLINKSAIKEIINNDFKEISSFLSNIFPVNEFKATLIYGELKGLGEQALAAPLAKKYNVEKETAALLVRTAVNYIHTKSEIKGMQSAGYCEYEFMTLGESADNVCEVCKALDGKVFSINEAVIGKNCPPMHIGCRCKVTTPQETLEDIQADIDRMLEGTSIEEIEQRLDEMIAEKEALRVCPKCNTELNVPIVNFCPFCGQQIK